MKPEQIAMQRINDELLDLAPFNMHPETKEAGAEIIAYELREERAMSKKLLDELESQAEFMRKVKFTSVAEKALDPLIAEAKEVQNQGKEHHED